MSLSSSEKADAWPFVFGAISLPHAAAFGAFMSRIDFDLTALSLLGFFYFMAMATVFTAYIGYLVEIRRAAGFSHWNFVIACVLMVAFIAVPLLGAVSEVNKIKEVVFLIATLLSWAFITYKAAGILNE